MATMTADNIVRNTLRPGFKPVPTDVVKAWALAEGLSVPERQGRLSNEVIDGFNKAHARMRRQYLPGGVEDEVTYAYTTASGKVGKFTARPSSVREWATEKGLTTAGRGRFSRAILDAYGQAHAPTRTRKPKAAASK